MDSETIQNEPKTCPRCGTLNQPGQQFCQKCGRSLTPRSPWSYWGQAALLVLSILVATPLVLYGSCVLILGPSFFLGGGFMDGLLMALLALAIGTAIIGYTIYAFRRT